jgi:hypothetical protein
MRLRLFQTIFMQRVLSLPVLQAGRRQCLLLAYATLSETDITAF